MNLKPNPKFLASMSLRRRSQWARALRSGQYSQGHAALYEKGLYCCLGVYCMIRGIDLGDGIGMPEQTGLHSLDAIFKTAPEGNPDIALDDVSAFSAAYLNDIRGYDFSAIADLVHSEGAK